MRATIDGVVYRDGSFIRPNKTRIWQRYLAARDAEHDEALAALRLLNSSRAQIPLEEAMGQDISRARKEQGQYLVSMYIRDRGRTAQDIVRLLHGRGSAWLHRVLTGLVDNSRENETPTPLAKYF